MKKTSEGFGFCQNRQKGLFRFAGGAAAAEAELEAGAGTGCAPLPPGFGNVAQDPGCSCGVAASRTDAAELGFPLLLLLLTALRVRRE